MIDQKFFVEQQQAVGESFGEIVQAYIQALSEAINTINQVWQADDLQQLSNVLHRIKGASGSIGANVLFDLLGAIENQVKAGEKPDLKVIKKLESIVEMTIEELTKE